MKKFAKILSRNYRLIAGIFLVFAILFLVAFLFKTFSMKKQVNKPNLQQNNPKLPSSLLVKETYKVKRVIDGDTIVLENGKIVRYIGIDAPELHHPKKKKVECFAKEAKKENEKLVLGKMVQLEKDVSETDRYGRLLRYVFVDGIFVNEYLVREGFALLATFPPDVKYLEVLKKAQKEALENKKGLWNEKNCKF